MKVFKPKFWNQKSFYSLILFPVSFLVIAFISIKKNLTRKINFDIPIICVGNIYIGGTGKTPLSIFIAKELSYKNKRPCIVRKYYKDHFDEYNMIKKKFKGLITDYNRSKALYLAQKEKFDLAILDDGLQDYKINKDLNIVCFNTNQLVGNGFVIPAGPLREKLDALKNISIVVLNGEKNYEFEKKILSINKYLKIFYSKYIPVNLQDFKEKKLLAMAGIGNPENFFSILSQNNIRIHKKISFPDHYKFDRSELLRIIDIANNNNCEIITTEKDYNRVKHFNFKELNYLKVDLKIENREEFLRNILEIYEKY